MKHRALQVLLKFTATGLKPLARGVCTLGLRVLNPRVCGAPSGEACTPRGSQSHSLTRLSPGPEDAPFASQQMGELSFRGQLRGQNI